MDILKASSAGLEADPEAAKESAMKLEFMIVEEAKDHRDVSTPFIGGPLPAACYSADGFLVGGEGPPGCLRSHHRDLLAWRPAHVFIV